MAMSLSLTVFVVVLLLGSMVSGCALRAGYAAMRSLLRTGAGLRPRTAIIGWAYRFKVCLALAEEPNWAVDLLLATGLCSRY